MIRCRVKFSPAWIGYRVAFVDALYVTRQKRGTFTYPAGAVFAIESLATNGSVRLLPDNGKDAAIHMNIQEINRNGGFLVIERPRSAPHERAYNSWEIAP